MYYIWDPLYYMHGLPASEMSDRRSTAESAVAAIKPVPVGAGTHGLIPAGERVSTCLRLATCVSCLCVASCCVGPSCEFFFLFVTCGRGSQPLGGWRGGGCLYSTCVDA